jgi:hypothetical protein
LLTTASSSSNVCVIYWTHRTFLYKPLSAIRLGELICPWSLQPASAVLCRFIGSRPESVKRHMISQPVDFTCENPVPSLPI